MDKINNTKEKSDREKYPNQESFEYYSRFGTYEQLMRIKKTYESQKYKTHLFISIKERCKNVR